MPVLDQRRPAVRRFLIVNANEGVHIMYDTQFERIASRIDEIETVRAYLHDSGRGNRDLAFQLEAELAALERRLEQIELFASYEPMLASEEG